MTLTKAELAEVALATREPQPAEPVMKGLRIGGQEGDVVDDSAVVGGGLRCGLVLAIVAQKVRCHG